MRLDDLPKEALIALVEHLSKAPPPSRATVSKAIETRPITISALEEAREFLLDELRDGEKPSKDVESAAKAADISATTLKRAKKELCRSIKRGSTWYMALLEPPPPSSSSAEVEPNRQVEQIEAWIAKRKERVFTHRQLHNVARRWKWCKRSEDLIPPLEAMIAAGRLRATQVGRSITYAVLDEAPQPEPEPPSLSLTS